MKRFIWGWAITMIAALTPALALAAGPGVAQQVANALRDSGKLKDYSINVKYQGGTAWLQGQVTTPQQMGQALAIAKGISGVDRVVNEMTINGAAQPAAAETKTAESAPRPFQLGAGAKNLFTGLTGNKSEPDAKPAGGAEPELKSADSGVVPAFGKPTPVVGPVIGGTPAAMIPAELSGFSGERTPVHTVSNRPQGEPAELGGVHPAVPMPEAGVGQIPVPSHSAMDQQIAQQIANEFRSGGRMKGYRIGVTVQNGNATLNGSVASKQQMAQAVFIAKQTRGVTNVVNELSIGDAAQPNPIQQAAYDPAAANRPAPAPYAVGPAPNRLAMAQHHAVPAEAMEGYSGEMMDGPVGGGGPMPAYGYGAAGAAPAHYDEPHMPGYAWPSYAAYPNYGAVTYPRQYSPTAWPYIGPFYPYPQVPLGWRKVTLEWDDGWWFLDFEDKNW